MSEQSRTFVLVHGAYMGGWSWRLVAERLEGAGHRVLAPTLDGCAERAAALRPGITTETHAAEIAALLYYEDLHAVTLVGTSSGGMVVCRAAELAPERVSRLSFVDALALRSGEGVPDIVSRPTAVTSDLATGPTAEDAASRLFAELDDGLRAWTVERLTPHPRAALEAPVMLGDFWERAWDAQVVYCHQSTNPPEAHQRRTADTLDARWDELDTGHYPMLTTPAELSALLLA